MAAARSSAPLAYRAVLLAAGLLVVGLVFRELVTLLLAVLITVLIAIPLAAFATRLARYRVPRAVGALLGLTLGLGVVAGILRLVIPQLVEELRTLANAIPEIVTSLQAEYSQLLGDAPGAAGDRLQRLVERFVDQPLELLSPILSIGLGVLGALFTLVLILLTAYYMAVQPQPLIDGMLGLFPVEKRSRALRVMIRLRAAWIGWMRGVLADMVVTGTLLYIGLALAGLEFALLFSAFSALLVVVPYFGAIAGGIPPVLLALTISPEKALVVLGIYVLVQQIEGNVIIPLIMSRAVRLHPALIAIGVVVVGQLFGLVGLFVAVPILAAFQTLADELWVSPLERAGQTRGPPAQSGFPAEPIGHHREPWIASSASTARDRD
jgi:predicted PurR-regulated permease PerM